MASSTSSNTLSLPGLEAYLGELGVPIPLPTFPSSDPINNPNDVYRSYIAAELEKLIGCDRALLYDSLQRTSTPSKGDLVLVVPRLRLKGVKPNELAAELSSKVYEAARRYPVFSCFGILMYKCVLVSGSFTAQPSPTSG
jgi:arginyl-tRNA synthetase